MFPFDVILFDVGGVLLTNGWDHCEREHVLDRFHVDKAAFETRHARLNDPWERDAISMQEYLDEVLFYEPRSFTREDFVTAICEESAVLSDSGIGILEELAASGKCMLGALNNEARVPNDYRFHTFGLRNYFDVTLSSCYLGLRKPHREIYDRAVDILSRPADRILFIDDRPENVAAALAVGMKAIQFSGAEPLRRELETLGVM
jgi:putative hydrolase of the HAD superfamily